MWIELVSFSCSSNFALTDGMYELLAAPSGRVLKYDVASNSSKVIMDELSFANGIVLSPDEDYILVNIFKREIWMAQSVHNNFFFFGGGGPGGRHSGPKWWILCKIKILKPFFICLIFQSFQSQIGLLPVFN